ncbi:MAG: hypothetical protein M3Q52_06190 [Pseudomonadota bacterium]|nr:hypothetical protein [Pseudomonadota bacterium]
MAPLACFARGGVDMKQVTSPLVLTTSGRLGIAISGIRIAHAAVPPARCSL